MEEEKHSRDARLIFCPLRLPAPLPVTSARRMGPQWGDSALPTSKQAKEVTAFGICSKQASFILLRTTVWVVVDLFTVFTLCRHVSPSLTQHWNTNEVQYVYQDCTPRVSPQTVWTGNWRGHHETTPTHQHVCRGNSMSWKIAECSSLPFLPRQQLAFHTRLLVNTSRLEQGMHREVEDHYISGEKRLYFQEVRTLHIARSHCGSKNSHIHNWLSKRKGTVRNELFYYNRLLFNLSYSCLLLLIMAPL